MFKNSLIKISVILFVVFTYKIAAQNILLTENWLYKTDLKGEINSPKEFPQPNEMKEIVIPHDFVISAYREEGSKVSDLTRGIYMNVFNSPKLKSGELLHLRISGVPPTTYVWLNDQLVNLDIDNQTVLDLNLTPLLNPEGEQNTIKISVPQYRFTNKKIYHGAGLLDSVFLYKSGKYAVPYKGVRLGYIVDENLKDVRITLEIDKATTATNATRYEAKIRTPEGKIIYHHNIASVKNPVRFKQHLLKNIMLWSPESPTFYSLEVKTLDMANNVFDVVEMPIAFREIELDQNKGLTINGEKLLLKAISYEPVFPSLGSALPKCLVEQHLLDIKNMGANAVKLGSGFYPSYIYRLCTQMGLFIVMEPTSFWENEADRRETVESMSQYFNLRRKESANEPSVILWSIGSESSDNDILLRDLWHVRVKNIDRHLCLLQGGIDIKSDLRNHEPSNANAVEILGIDGTKVDNESLASFNLKYPTARGGVYMPNMSNSQFLSEGIQYYSQMKNLWYLVENSPTLIGYIGESYLCPLIKDCEYNNDVLYPSSKWGIKNRMYGMYKGMWSIKPSVNFLSVWDNSTSNNDTIPVFISSNTGEVEVLLNGTSYGRFFNSPHDILQWNIPYKRGTLHAVGYDNGIESDRVKIVTSSSPDNLLINISGNTFDGVGSEILCYVDLIDHQGNLAKADNYKLKISMPKELELVFLGGNDNSSFIHPSSNNLLEISQGSAVFLVKAVQNIKKKLRFNVQKSNNLFDVELFLE